MGIRLKTFFVIVIFLVIATRCGSIGFKVVEATYGANCTSSSSPVVPGNMTSIIAADCDHGKGSCTFSFTLDKLKRMGGDPAVGCVKDLSVSYKCDMSREIHTAKANGEALYQNLVLQCPEK